MIPSHPHGLAEDIILQQIIWYRMGSGIAERQWNDVLGVTKVQRERRGRDYLAHWAKVLGVGDLLMEAIDEAMKVRSEH